MINFILMIAFSFFNLKAIHFLSDGKKARPLVVIALTLVITAVTSQGDSFSLEMLLKLLLWNVILVIGYVDALTLTMVDALTYAVGVIAISISFMNKLPWQFSVFGFAIGGLLYGAVYILAYAYYKREAFGLGDVLLLAALGILLGPLHTLLAGFLTFYVAIIGIIVQKAMNRKLARESEIAFGPYICLAAWIIFLWGNDIIEFYVKRFL